MSRRSPAGSARQRAGNPLAHKHPAAPESHRNWLRHAGAVAALWVVALAAYSNSFQNTLTLDSVHLIAVDARVHAATAENAGLIWSGEYWYKIGGAGLYRPLTTSSFLFNYAILGNGPNPAGYHWVNFGLHAINILLVYALAFILVREIPLAAAIAGLWGLHPVAVEAVTNIAGRADLLAAFAVLAGLLCHIRAGGATQAARRAAWLAALMSAAAVGFFSKENAVVLPAVMLFYDVAFRTPRDGPPAAWRKLLPGYLALAPPLVLYFVFRAKALGHASFTVFPFLENPLTRVDFWTGRITAVKVLGKYLYLLLWPANLSADYSYNQVPLFTWRFDSMESWKAVFAVAAWSAVVLLGIRAFRGQRRVFFFVAFFVVTMAPTANLVILTGSIMAERFLYLPSVGFAGCLAAAVYAASGRWSRARRAAPAILIAVCLAFAVRVYARNRDWLDPITLWTHDAGTAPDSYKTHASLAEALWQQGSSFHDHATAERERAVSLIQDLAEERQSAIQYVALGICYREKGDEWASRGADFTSQSGAWYAKSLEALLRAERVTRAQSEELRRSFPLGGKQPPSTDLPRIYLERGRTYRSLAQPARALEAFQQGRALQPDIGFFAEIARAHEELGNPRAAGMALLEGIVADPVQTGFAAKAIDLYRRADPQSCASLAGGSGLNLQCPMVRNDLCTAGWNVVNLYLQSGKRQEAHAIRTNTLASLGCASEPTAAAPAR